MKDGLQLLEELHAQSHDILQTYNALPEKDIRRKHIEILTSQIAVSLVNLKINIKFEELNKKEFLTMFGGDDQQAQNYIHNSVQNLLENIFESAVFQSELAFRFLHAKITGQDVGQEKNFYKIVADLFSDTENNWTKEQSKLVILLWTFRNTIHTGGIYFQKAGGDSLTYKGKEYKFEYGKAPSFLKDGHMLELIADLLETIKYAFDNEPIRSLPPFDHPAYFALDY